MKKLLSILLFMLLISRCFGWNYIDWITSGIPLDYVASYLFEDNGNDVTTNHNATMSNVTYADTTPVSTTSGKYGIFNGTTSYGQVTDHADITNLKTIVCWMYLNSFTSGGGRLTEKSTTNRFITLDTGLTNNNSLVLDISFSTTSGQWQSPVNSISTSSWIHVAYTYAMDNNVNTDPLFYINGQSVSVTEHRTPVGTIDGDTGGDLYIGNRGAYDRGFDGNIDNLHLYDRVLTPTEILAIYNAEKP